MCTFLIFSKINQHNNLSLLLTDSLYGMNFIFANITESSRYFNFTISAGATRSFDLIIIDDNFAESYYYDYVYFYIGVYVSSDRYYCDNGYIDIENNDGMCGTTLYTKNYTTDVNKNEPYINLRVFAKLYEAY